MSHKHKCFISFKKEDSDYRDKIVERLSRERITGKSLDNWIDSDDIDYIMRVIREEYMKNTSVTIFIIGRHSSENEGFEKPNEDGYEFNKQNYIIRELKATLYDGDGNRRSGLLGVVLPEMYDAIYGSSFTCSHCGKTISIVNINQNTVIKEFSENYYLDPDCTEGHCNEDGRFCVLVRYDDFMKRPDEYINKAFNKLNEPINNQVHWRDINHVYKK